MLFVFLSVCHAVPFLENGWGIYRSLVEKEMEGGSLTINGGAIRIS